MSKTKLSLYILIPFWLFFASGVSYGRYAAIMIDADNGNVLHEVDASRPWYPASLTKVMTLYMTFEALKTGEVHLYDNITASSHAASQPTSKLGLRAGERLTVEDAILALITRSANDAAVVLAERLGGTEDNFAIQMTEKARSLGMHSTRFMNATGLPNDWQVTTSRDMAVLAWKIQRNFPQYYPYFSSHSFYFKGRELRAINKFTARYPGAEGMKTGYTCGSGFNLIGSASQNGKHLIGVVLGGVTSAERYQLMMDMMDNGFSDRYIADAGRNIDTMPVSYGGEPPYQLNCGKGARNQVVAAHTSRSSSDYHRHAGRHLNYSKSKRYNKRQLAASSKSASSHRVAKTTKRDRTRLASGRKSSSSVHTARAGKSARGTKKASHSKMMAKAKPVSRSKAIKTAKNRSLVDVKTRKKSGYHHAS